MVDLTLLDQSVAKLAEDAAELPLEDLLALLGAEQIGKTRKGAIDLLEGLIASLEMDEPNPAEPANDIEALGDEIMCEALDLDGSFVIVPMDDPRVVHNSTPNTTLHLGDGRRLAFGHFAIAPELAAQRREHPE